MNNNKDISKCIQDLAVRCVELGEPESGHILIVLLTARYTNCTTQLNLWVKRFAEKKKQAAKEHRPKDVVHMLGQIMGIPKEEIDKLIAEENAKTNPDSSPLG